MSKISKTFDIFLSYSHDLTSQSKVIAKKFANNDFIVFDSSEIKPNQNLTAETWKALAESWAIVVLIKPGIMPPSVAVEIGAATAWHKPIYIITVEKDKNQLPLYLLNYRIFEISEIEEVIKRILKSLKPLNNSEREALVEAYQQLGLPTDQLLRHPPSIDLLYQMLSNKLHIELSNERIMQELLRLRKRGKLPRVRHRN